MGYLLNLEVTNGFLFTDMAGLAPEGAQFDTKQYDTKMSEM